MMHIYTPSSHPSEKVKEFEFPSLYFFEIIDSIFREKGQHFYQKRGDSCMVVSDAGPLYLFSTNPKLHKEVNLRRFKGRTHREY